ncbi:PepSY domain-containing protein [Roseivirga sp. BDSF3-8]|uniref:PepSY domain-containing protein n=1 Tax=Roseivirga sp. BDSF3-8 TaxID=3241598 RepID=UPI003531F272
MSEKEREKRKRKATVIRRFRKVHRYSGVALFVFLFIIGITSVLLGWKKNSGDLLMPETRRGTAGSLAQWLPLDSLQLTAYAALPDGTYSLDRIDVRPEKGMAKFRFKEGNMEVQVDGITGHILHKGPRVADLVESIHDGSYIDDLLGTGGVFKVFYSTVTGLALTMFVISGFWLWYGPKRMRR